MQLATFLSDATSDAVLDLMAIPFFHDMMQNWNTYGRQGDSVEFLTFLLTGLNCHAFSFAWEKRLQVGLAVAVMDQNGAFAPPVLQFDPEQLHDDHALLSQLIKDWCNQHGMQIAFTANTPLLCFEIDRHVHRGDGSVTTSDIPVHYSGVCHVPFFVDDSLQIAWQPYQVLALTVHIGNDNAGHCRAILRVHPDVHATSNEMMYYTALLTDDWCLPEPCWRLPSWIASHVTSIWLGHCPEVELPRLEAVPAAPTVAAPVPEHVRGPPMMPSLELLHMFDEA